MSNSNEHISIFEELVRILFLYGKPGKPGDRSSIYDSVKITHVPHEEKSEKLIDELIKYHTKLNTRKGFRWYLPIGIVSGLLLFFMVYYQFNKNDVAEVDKEFYEKKERKPVNRDTVKVITGIKDTNTAENKTPKNRMVKEKRSEKETVVIVSDKKDSITTPAETKDSTTVFEETPVFPEGSYCFLPVNFHFFFKKKSVKPDEKYVTELASLAERMIDCYNLKEIEIKGYYTQNLLLFNNKKLVTERITELKKELKKLNVPSRTLRKAKIELIKTEKNDNPETAESIEIILSE